MHDYLSEISLWDAITRKISISAITGYQKHISPHKGFVCAHRVLYGGEPCSQYFKRVITEQGLKSAFNKSNLRFKQCKQANIILKSQNQESQQKKRQQDKSQSSYCPNTCDCPADIGIDVCDIDCFPDIGDCTPDCGVLDCGGCG
ncbi:MAG: membrane protein insertion efficiency factor YidD [Nostocales cyanobacterium]|nr:MAG: membrane protein insertion efficiency factor YidD [Nostocales cyanobacterium]TAF12882.1 MAG: membrane protein insertion efficiency factor YidD [Nostocales cyanobacterium]